MIKKYLPAEKPVLYYRYMDNPQTRQEVGRKLKEARLKKKLSQGDVAKILGVHRTYISGLERGVRNPSLLTIQKVAKALGVDAKKLI